MPAGELFIKNHDGIEPTNNSLKDGWVDAYLQWGVSFSETSLSLLMTPAPNKAAIENKSRTHNGKAVIKGQQYVKKDERDVSLEMHITAKDRTEFWERYDRFCAEVLDYGFLDIKTVYRPNNVFRFTYLSCTQFSEFMQEAAKFVLRLNEPDPSNRGIDDSTEI